MLLARYETLGRQRAVHHARARCRRRVGRPRAARQRSWRDRPTSSTSPSARASTPVSSSSCRAAATTSGTRSCASAIVEELLPGESTRLHVRYAEALTRAPGAPEGRARAHRTRGAHLVPVDGGSRRRTGVRDLDRRDASRRHGFRVRECRPDGRSGSRAVGPGPGRRGDRRDGSRRPDRQDRALLAERRRAAAVTRHDRARSRRGGPHRWDRPRPAPARQGDSAQRRRPCGCGPRFRGGARRARCRTRSRCSGPTSWPSSRRST